jgi:hypothetical protein
MNSFVSAGTTDAIFLEKPQYYDLVIDLTTSTPMKVSRPTFYASRSVSQGKFKLSVIRFAWSDVKLVGLILSWHVRYLKNILSGLNSIVSFSETLETANAAVATLPISTLDPNPFSFGQTPGAFTRTSALSALVSGWEHGGPTRRCRIPPRTGRWQTGGA